MDRQAVRCNIEIAFAFDERRVDWNAQIEQLTGIRREKAVGRTLAELLPAELVEQFTRVRGENGIHHIYKFVLKPAAIAVANGRGHGNGGPSARLSAATLNIAITPLVSKDQEQIGRTLLSHIEKLRALRVEIDRGIRSLDAGKGTESSIDDFIRQKNR